MTEWSSQVFTLSGVDDINWQDKITHVNSDIFHTDNYMATFENSLSCEASNIFGGEAILFVYGDKDNFISYPFFKRELAELPFYKEFLKDEAPIYDITSPYGYAGPIEYITQKNFKKELWTAFLTEFHNFCVSNNIITEFIRLNPFLGNHEYLSSVTEGVSKSGVIVYIDLTAGQDAIWKNMKKSNRNSITRAMRSNIDIFKTNSLKDLNEFIKLYNETMTRREAKKMYYFPNEFYYLLQKNLKEKVSLFVAKCRDEIVSGSLFLGKGSYFHYYLSGTSIDNRYNGAANLLLYEAIIWAKNQGYQIFNLGGGYNFDDSLFKFKSSFSKTTIDFFTYRKVHQEDKYKILCDAVDKYNNRYGAKNLNLIYTDYFPYYRR